MFREFVSLCVGFYAGAYFQDKYKLMDLSTLLAQRIPDSDATLSSPYLIFINSRALNVSHEEILGSTISSFFTKSGEIATASLLLAARQPLSRYTDYLDPLVRRSMGKHQLYGFDFADELVKNPLERCEETLTLSINRLINDLELLSEERKLLLVIDDLSYVKDLGVSPRKLISRLLNSSIHYLLIGYHNNNDGITDDYLFHLLHRRADFFLDVSPLDTGYSNTIDGKLTISTPNNEMSSSGETQLDYFKIFAEGRTIRCYTQGASNLVR
ncbi:unnamed protein product [Hymenolepis diminuta]|uniref:Elongator complex protein 6 n=2 Tax=Hymenolepis diminuta TaxID=6216 RepID=A0A0R3SAT5_HYMDI|nr:unnamed protein product [Hymenolepis diminuta]